jgi:SAM-dependent methyltransferase
VPDSPFPDWTPGFFTGLIAESLRTWASPEQTAQECAFLADAFERAGVRPGAMVLDVACGAGRLSLALAERGFDVTGVDLSSELVAEAAAAAGKAPVGERVRFEVRDMRRLGYRETFRAVFCFGNSFSYFDDAGNREFLRGVWSALEPGGVFVLETHFTAETLFGFPAGRKWFEMGEFICLYETEYDPATSRWTSRYGMLKGGAREDREATYTVYLQREVVDRFREAGFTEIETFGSLSREAFRIGAQGLYLVARRN